MIQASYLLILLFFFTLPSFRLSQPLPIKRFLMIVFPGGRSHNYVIQSLFEYTKQHESQFKYEYHIIIHNIDIDTWEQKNNTDGYFIYGYGNKATYHTVFGAALEMVNTSPTLGFLNFHRAMKFNYREFMTSGILEQLKGISFDVIGTDVPNYIYVLLETVMKIPLKVVISPPAIPQIDFEVFELNPSYTPAVGSKYSDVMSFSERLVNFWTLTAIKIMFKTFVKQQANVFKEYGYHLTKSVYYPDAVHFFQYPLGLAFPLSFPPNIITLNAITPKESRPIKESNIDIDVFLSKQSRNVYLSQGTIMNIMALDDIIDIFTYFARKDIGFVVSWRNTFITEDILRRMPSNVLIVQWVNQNDLLGDERISCFITHGGINSVSESIYHYKPMVVLGVSLDQLNTAAFAKKANVGVVIQDKQMITSKNLIKSINDLLENKTYSDNVIRLGKLLRDSKDPHAEFKYWMDFGYKHSFDSLFIDMYIHGTWWTINGFDVFTFSLVLLIIFIIFQVWLWKKLITSCIKSNTILSKILLSLFPQSKVKTT